MAVKYFCVTQVFDHLEKKVTPNLVCNSRLRTSHLDRRELWVLTFLLGLAPIGEGPFYCLESDLGAPSLCVDMCDTQQS